MELLEADMVVAVEAVVPSLELVGSGASEAQPLETFLPRVPMGPEVAAVAEAIRRATMAQTELAALY